VRTQAHEAEVGAAGDLVTKMTLEGFDTFNDAFRAITRRAGRRFDERDWQGERRDAAERLDAYEKTVIEVADRLERSLGPRAFEQVVWRDAKNRFAALAAERYDIDRAETFFNSLTRKLLNTVGINRDVEFFYLHPKPTPSRAGGPICRCYTNPPDTSSLIREIFRRLPLHASLDNPERDIDLVSQEVDLCLWPIVGRGKHFSIDIVTSLFYRNKTAYVVGRIVTESRVIPFIIPLTHGESGIRADTVLLHEAEAMVLFSFAYSYFFVDLDRYDLLIDFLRSIMPQAALSELYSSLGYDRHGKTEFYRDLHRFVHVSREQFIIAPGLEGAVMIAFTLPNFPFVFKVIKDRPCFLRSAHETPKEITEKEVRDQYAFVSHRDRSGRMVDTQEFENLRFKTKRFSAPLLGEFAQAATRNVAVKDDYVVVRRAYVQRKVVPFPLYLDTEKDPETIRRVLVDFGYFLKDIASSGVFPCDLFNTWNYGVTHWGRVVLYDYDDVLPMERVRFREKPTPRDEQQEIGPEEEWINAAAEDFFVDEIDRYSGIPVPLKGVFKSVHGDLFTLKFWNNLTGRLAAGEIFDVIPYERSKRFSERGSTSPRPPA